VGIDGLSGNGTSPPGGVFPSTNTYHLQFFHTGNPTPGSGGGAYANLLCQSSYTWGVSMYTVTTLPCTTNLGGDPAGQEGWVRVPEPATLPLVLLAVSIGWLARRRA
jgi:hypothetical protein